MLAGYCAPIRKTYPQKCGQFFGYGYLSLRLRGGGGELGIDPYKLIFLVIYLQIGARKIHFFRLLVTERKWII